MTECKVDNDARDNLNNKLYIYIYLESGRLFNLEAAKPISYKSKTEHAQSNNTENHTSQTPNHTWGVSRAIENTPCKSLQGTKRLAQNFKQQFQAH